MTEGRAVPLTTIIRYALWGWVLSLVIAGWVCMASGLPHLSNMLGFTACASSAVAVTASMRCYSLRVQRLIRAAHGFDAPVAPAELRTIP